jgi:hypothetical protein
MGGQTDRETDGRKYMTKVIGAFGNNENSPRKQGLKEKQK